MTVEIKMPQLGQTSDEVRLIRWLIKEGDTVERGQSLCEVETDKVTMEFESVAGGIVKKLNFKPDDQIKTGDTIAVIDDSVKTGEYKKQKISSEEGFSKTVKETGKETGKETTIETGRETKASEYAESAGFKPSILKPADLKQKRKIISEIGTARAIQFYKKMFEIREFEEAIKTLFLEGKMPGTIHQYMGQEACAVGVCAALEKGDVIASTHRPHGHAIARGLSLDEIMAELYGKTTGCCRGKGGSMHIGNLDKGMLPAIAIVGGNIPIAGGMALAFKLKKEPRVAVSFFGDGASNEGAFHEGINMAAIYNLPVVFVCENNLYGASTSIKKTLKLENISDRACAYGIRSDIADGMDVLDVYIKAKNAIDIARDKFAPTILELKTFRFCGHSRRDPCNYMTKEEKDYWQSKDPLIVYEKFLISEGIVKDDYLEKVKAEVKNSINQSIVFAQESPEPQAQDTYNDLYVNMEVPR